MGHGTGQINQSPAQPAGKAINKKHRIIVSFTTISTRIKYINPMIHSLFTQSLIPDEVYLWISKEPFLHDAGILPEAIPEKLQKIANFNNSPFKIRYTENTAGYRKLLPILEENKNREDVVIITADDDTLYPKWWIARLYTHFLEHQCIIAYRARKIRNKPDGTLAPYNSWPLLNSWDYCKDLQLCPTGKDGVLYCPAFFDNRILDPVYKTLSPTRADFWYAGNAIANKIMTVHVPSTKPLPWRKHRKDFPVIPVPQEVREKWPELYLSNYPKNDLFAKNVFRHFSII